MEEEILNEGPMSGAMIYISDFQNKLAWKFDISVSETPTRREDIRVQ